MYNFPYINELLPGCSIEFSQSANSSSINWFPHLIYGKRKPNQYLYMKMMDEEKWVNMTKRKNPGKRTHYDGDEKLHKESEEEKSIKQKQK